MNGKPYSLFFGKEVRPHGVVGMAVVGGTKLSGRVVADGTKIGPVMEVSKARGNIIMTVDGEGNPTRQLLAAVNDRGFPAQKDEQFFLSLSLPGDPHNETLTHKVTSGDPSKGLISVDTTRDIPVGAKIQVCCCCLCCLLSLSPAAHALPFSAVP